MTILLYTENGGNKFSIDHATAFFSSIDKVKHVTSNEVIAGDIFSDASVFVMPGGADKFYAEKLNGAGNEKIKSYVADGGVYIGICAGSYYGGSRISFAEGTKEEIIEERELGFFPGSVHGPAYPGFAARTHKGAHPAMVSGLLDSPIPLYLNGGGFFADADLYDNVTVLARFSDLSDSPAAIISCDYGNGKAILSSVHFEIDPHALDPNNPDLEKTRMELIKFNDQRINLTHRLLWKFK